MTIHNLSAESSILNKFLAEIRDQNIQKDRMRFRKNIERIGEVLAYELSKSLSYNDTIITSPLGKKSIKLISENLVICSVLRAGISLHNGLLNYFDAAENAFISAYRKHTDTQNFTIEVEYLASPSFKNKTLILADPMLATGRSLVETYRVLLKNGTPNSIHVVVVIGSAQGIEYLTNNFPEDTHLWIATIDKELNENDYIIPGLGDAGDLAFGPKL
jgi:uracil phosphoribosyltransferase